MANQLESLNAGVAASVALYAVARGARLTVLAGRAGDRAVGASSAHGRAGRVAAYVAVWLVVALAGRAGALPDEQPHDRGGQPRRGGAARR